MIKKILLIVFILNFVFACGKKGDPVYKESKIYKSYKTIIIK